MTREQVWIHTKDEKEIGVYHPENDGYCVVSIQKGAHNMYIISMYKYYWIMFVYVVWYFLSGDTALLSPATNFEQKLIGYVIGKAGAVSNHTDGISQVI